MQLIIRNFHLFTDAGKHIGQFLDQMHFNIEIDGQSGVLMGGIYRATHEEMDLRSIHAEHTGDTGRTVLLIAPLLIGFAILQILSGQFHHTVDGNNTLRHQIHALQLRYRRNIGIDVFKSYPQGLIQMLGRNRRGGAAANDMPALRLEELRHHLITVIPIGGGIILTVTAIVFLNIKIPLLSGKEKQ